MINISELSFTYPVYSRGASQKKKEVLSSFSLSAEDGERVLIYAPPDSGKTTLMKILCKAIPSYTGGTINGRIEVDRTDLFDVSGGALTGIITYVSQNPQEQLLMNTCCDEIAFPLESLCIDPDEMDKRIESALSHWGLSELSEVHPQELSGGERKRLLLAVTEAIGAPNWLFDEVFDDLDINYKQQLLNVMKAHKGTIIVSASRFLPEFAGMFTRIVSIADGGCRNLSEKEVMNLTSNQMKVLQYQRKMDNESSSVLSLRSAIVTHPRKSVSSAVPFTLSVPSFSITRGEIIALVGPNGSGKSTLSRVLCGLDPLCEGSLTVDGRPMGQSILKQNVGYMFQNPDYSIFLPTVYDELTYSLKNDTSVVKSERDAAAQMCADVFDLVLDDNPSLMSYGHRKRLQGAIYYLLQRSFIIIDELDAGITYQTAYKIISLFQEKGCGVIVISHDAPFADSVAQRTYEISGGEVRLRDNR